MLGVRDRRLYQLDEASCGGGRGEGRAWNLDVDYWTNTFENKQENPSLRI